MSEHPYRLAVIVASTREGRFAPVIANWFTRHAAQHAHLDVDVIDLDAVRPYELRHGSAEFETFAKRVDEADAFVVITPEYNHSFPAPLKHAIDLLHHQWQAKPVGFVSYGGVSGGLRAVEQLRLVFAELHATTVRETVSFALAGNLFDGAGRLRDPAPATQAADALLRQLTWWALALREARAARPYGA
ncbi:NAD(P)H-dependent oxidoreductase [Streptomyces angustmyceticus]|uniref:Putative reductase n=1 Tax=Streptomyces angustmyceticus TaxID=285578 RepID=A0A5J4LSN3_9ACTN|nr:NAD(P)H-dependent oxidoreductase [Streptomyces angustmyceticus]UAL67739.1 NAD(P)H-dependent oxidoreductase [Streptomyces angustmyceticus]GES34506.1 putative reductase [Streptomyces angustmyceticus]